MSRPHFDHRITPPRHSATRDRPALGRAPASPSCINARHRLHSLALRSNHTAAATKPRGRPNNGRINADNFIVANNIVVNNGRDGIKESGATGSKNQFVNNIIWNNGTQRINLQTGQQRGTLLADPDFVDFKPDGSGDYHLRPGSPGLGAGVQLGAPASDIDGKPRPTNGGVDIGIYQR